MMHKPYMLDTNTCSFIMRGAPVSVLARLHKAVSGQRGLLISAITYMELRRGACNPKASPKLHQTIDQFLQRIHGILPFGRVAAEFSGRVYGQLAAQGQLIGNNDIGIAGHCLAADCILVTNNTREFARVEGLEIEDWAAPE